MSAFLAPIVNGGPFFIPGTNTPAAGGQFFFYANKSTTKITVYKDPAASVAWTNPIVLDSGGNLPGNGEIWFQTGQAVTVVFAPAIDTDPPASPYWTKDDLAGINDVTTTSSEWQSGPTPTFISATSFSVVGDQRATFTSGRRLKSTNTAGTIYSTITSVVFGANTTVSVANDSGALDAGLSAVFYGALDPANPSIDGYHVNRKATAVASSGNGTTNIWGISGNYVHVTGTNTIRSFSTAPYAGAFCEVIFDGALSLNSSAAITMPANLNVTTAANDRADIFADTTSTAIVNFYKQSGAITLSASQAQQESVTTTGFPVTPSVQQYHPSAAKAWCFANNSGGIAASYGISSVTDVATGRIGFNFTTSFSSVNYCAVVTANATFQGAIFAYGDVSGTQTAARWDAQAGVSTTGSAADPSSWYAAFFGDQ